MRSRLAMLIRILDRRRDDPGVSAEQLALELGATPETVRRDLRDLREAGAFDRTSRDLEGARRTA